MKTVYTAALVALLATTAMSTPALAREEGVGNKPVRIDRREVRQDRHELRKEMREGDRSDVMDARRELRQDRHELNDDLRDRRKAIKDHMEDRKEHREEIAEERRKAHHGMEMACKNGDQRACHVLSEGPGGMRNELGKHDNRTDHIKPAERPHRAEPAPAAGDR